jgi:hypothetical protein
MRSNLIIFGSERFEHYISDGTRSEHRTDYRKASPRGARAGPDASADPVDLEDIRTCIL